MPQLIIVTEDDVDLVSKLSYTIKSIAPKASVAIKNIEIKELDEECAIATD